MKIKIVSKRGLLVLGCLIILVAVVGVFFHLNKARTCRVAFYGVPEDVVAVLTEEITAMRHNQVTFTVLDQEKPLPFAAASSYTLLFAWNGKAAEEMASHGKAIPEQFLSLFPQQIAASVIKNTDGRHNRFAVPLLLDHIETAYYRIYREQLGLELPQTYAAWKAYLDTSVLRAEYPLMIAGADDRALLDFVSLIASSQLDVAAYKELCTALTQTKKKDALPKDLCRVLDEIKAIEQQRVMHQNWLQVQKRDVDNFMEWRQVSVVPMRLSEHRKKVPAIIRSYDAEPLPALTNRRALIVPILCAVVLNNKASELDIVAHLISEETQDKLSLITQLAPATLRAPAADRQADDVRYWAASNVGGIAAPLDTAAYENPEQGHQLAERIRHYLLGL